MMDPDEAHFRHPTQSIRARLLTGLLVPMALLLVVVSAVAYRLTTQPVHEAYDQGLLDTAVAVAAYVQAQGDSVLVDLSPQAVAVMRFDSVDQVYFAVTDGIGRLVAGDPGLPLAPMEEFPTGPRFYDGEMNGRRVRIAVIEVPAAGKGVIIQVAETTRKREIQSRRILIWLTSISVVLWLVTFLFVFVSLSSGLRPLNTLREEILTRSPEDLHPLDLKQVPAEVEPLVAALNRLLNRIGDTQAAQRRFIENAAHQLRTPLAALQTQIDLAVDVGAESGRMEIIQSTVRRVSHLASQLLTLARTEPASHDMSRKQRVDLVELVESTVAGLYDLALQREHDLGADAETAVLSGVHWELRELLTNLVENAIVHSPPGATITVRCGYTDRQPFLEVEDSGPGIPPDERGKVFERFYRIQGTTASGSGLGLAIVRDIAMLHGATIQLRDIAYGFAVRVVFPQSVDGGVAGQ